MDLHTQLYLAMIWDRVDLAEEKILAGASIQGWLLTYESNLVEQISSKYYEQWEFN